MLSVESISLSKQKGGATKAVWWFPLHKAISRKNKRFLNLLGNNFLELYVKLLGFT